MNLSLKQRIASLFILANVAVIVVAVAEAAVVEEVDLGQLEPLKVMIKLL